MQRLCLLLWLPLLLLSGAGGAPTYEPPLGMGMVNPPFSPERPLYLYAAPALHALPQSTAPADSVTFEAGPHHLAIAYAPPWFDAETMKLDYDLLYLRAVTLTARWIEVVVNTREPLPRTFPRTMWVDREAVTFRPWSEFLLGVHSIETRDPAANPLRSGPGESTAEVGATEGLLLRPVAVQGDWLRVEDAGFAEEGTLSGWIRWRDEGRLLVVYNLLS